MKGMRNISPFGLRMPDELREAVADRAKENGRSINSEIIDILTKSLVASSLDDEAFVYMLEAASKDNVSGLSDEDRNEVELILIQMAEKLNARIEKESSTLKQVIKLLSDVKKPT